MRIVFLTFSAFSLPVHSRRNKLSWDAQFGSINSRTGTNVTPENSQANSTENTRPWDAIGTHLVKTFVCYEPRRVSIMDSTACQWTLHWARRIMAASLASAYYLFEIQVVPSHQLIRLSGNISYYAKILITINVTASCQRSTNAY